MRPTNNTSDSRKEPPTARDVIVDMENDIRTVPELGIALVIMIENTGEKATTGYSCDEEMAALNRVARLLIDFARSAEQSWENAFALSVARAAA